MSYTRFYCPKCGYSINKDHYHVSDLNCPLGHGGMLKKTLSVLDCYFLVLAALSIILIIAIIILIITKN